MNALPYTQTGAIISVLIAFAVFTAWGLWISRERPTPPIVKPKYDLAVAYRVCPKLSDHASEHYTNKFQLVKECAESFKAASDCLRVKMFLILDGCEQPYVKLLGDLWPDALWVRHDDPLGDHVTLGKQVELLLNQNYAENVMLLEDDYLFARPITEAVGLLGDAEFVSPFHHPDILSTKLHDVPYEYQGGFRTAMSTTHTFLTTKTVLRECGDVFTRSYGRLSPDLAKWMALTKVRVFNPWFFVYSLFKKPFWAVSMAISWLFIWDRVLFGKRYRLWVPFNSIAVHLSK